jgi:hypothetical protein
MATRYFGAERVFERIWQDADADGLWQGDSSILAEEFDASEDAAHAVLSELCDRRLIEMVGERCYAIVNWRETEKLAGDER